MAERIADAAAVTGASAVTGAVKATGAAAPAAQGPDPCIVTMARRADFLRAASARRQGTASFLLQARERRGEAAESIRVGFTCSRKVGNAVLRNRAKRRLRAIAREVLPRLGQRGWDYVLVGRPGATVDRPFAAMIADMERAMAAVHAPPRSRPGAGA